MITESQLVHPLALIDQPGQRHADGGTAIREHLKSALKRRNLRLLPRRADRLDVLTNRLAATMVGPQFDFHGVQVSINAN